MKTPCNHYFHRDCLLSWTDVKLECPTCRRELPPLWLTLLYIHSPSCIYVFIYLWKECIVLIIAIMHPVLFSLAKQQPATTGPLINSMSIKIISAFAFGQIPSILSCLGWRQSTQKGRLLAGSTRVLRKQRTRPKIVKVVFLNELSRNSVRGFFKLL